ncbi:MAG: histidine kinase [Flavobacteriales bacterium]
MVRSCFIFCFIFIVKGLLVGQVNYLDSIEQLVKNLPEEEHIKEVLNLPYDKVVANTTKAEIIYLNALEKAKNLNHQEFEADIYNQLALVYGFLGNYDKRIGYNIKAIKIYERLGKKSKAGSTYGGLGFSMYGRDIEKAKMYMQKGIRQLEEAKDYEALNSTYDNYGIVQEVSGNVDSAIFYYNKALGLKINQNDSIGIPFALGHLSGAYLIKKDFVTSKKYLDESYAIRKKRNDTYGVAECLVLYADFYYAQNNYKEAASWFFDCYKMAIENNYIHLAQYAAEFLSVCHEKLGNTSEAISYLKIQQGLKDSLLNERTNKAIAELEIQFDTEKKEKQIIEQKVKLTEQELKNKVRTNQLVILVAVLLLVMVAGFFIYKQQKLRQQKLIEENRLKDQLAKIKIQNELQEERLRISRDLHDNIGSQLTFIISSVDNMKYLFKNTDEKLNTKLVDISTFTRITIAELRDTIWALNKDDITFDDLKSRLYNYIEQAKSAQEKIIFNFENLLTNNYSLNAVQGVNLYRIVQEAVNNAMKYSIASNITLKITETNTEIILEVVDNGIGFEIDKIGTGNGLHNMKNRADKINTIISIDSKPEIGTKISVILRKDTLNAV